MLMPVPRDPGKVKNETVANLSVLPDHVVDLIDAGLKGQQLVSASDAVTITRSLPHRHVAAVHAMARELGLPALLGPAGRPRDLSLALIISRVVAPASKLSTLTWRADTTLGADLGVADASTDDIYAAMDWLAHRQDAIEAGLAARHLAPAANPARMALFDLSSSWLAGTHPLAACGYSRDGKKGTLQIEYGLLTDPEGRPVAVRVFPGNTGDPGAFTAIADVVRKKFGLAQMVMAGDRGMITSARIQALNQREDGTQRPDPYGWITALRAPATKKLMADDGPLQLSLFDQQDLAEITSPDFPGEQLVACRNPVLAADRARKREDLLAATAANDTASVERFVDEWLARQIDYDSAHGTQLVLTLSEYLECGGNYDASARALSVHRSTLKYRLNRIRQVSGYDLGLPDNQFNLQLATRAWRTRQALRRS